MKVAVCRLIQIGLSICLSVMPTFAQGVPDTLATARLITTSAACPGGMCVVLGSESSDLPVSLSQQGRFVVQALVPERATLEEVRLTLRSGEA